MELSANKFFQLGIDLKTIRPHQNFSWFTPACLDFNMNPNFCANCNISSFFRVSSTSSILVNRKTLSRQAFVKPPDQRRHCEKGGGWREHWLRPTGDKCEIEIAQVREIESEREGTRLLACAAPLCPSSSRGPLPPPHLRQLLCNVAQIRKCYISSHCIVVLEYPENKST